MYAKGLFLAGAAFLITTVPANAQQFARSIGRAIVNQAVNPGGFYGNRGFNNGFGINNGFGFNNGLGFNNGIGFGINNGFNSGFPGYYNYGRYNNGFYNNSYYSNRFNNYSQYGNSGYYANPNVYGYRTYPSYNSSNSYYGMSSPNYYYSTPSNNGGVIYSNSNSGTTYYTVPQGTMASGGCGSTYYTMPGTTGTVMVTESSSDITPTTSTSAKVSVADQGLKITELPNGNAKTAGLKTGDIIVRVEDQRTSDFEDLRRILTNTNQDKVKVEYRDQSGQTRQRMVEVDNTKIGVVVEEVDLPK